LGAVVVSAELNVQPSGPSGSSAQPLLVAPLAQAFTLAVTSKLVAPSVVSLPVVRSAALAASTPFAWMPLVSELHVDAPVHGASMR